MKAKFVPAFTALAIAAAAVPAAMAASSGSETKTKSNCPGAAQKRTADMQFAKQLAAKLGGDVTKAKVTKQLDAIMKAERTANDGKRPDQLTDAQREAKAAEFLTKLADGLGVTETKLKAALVELAEERIAKDLKSGSITQEQADQMKEEIKDGKVPLMHGPGGRGHGPAPTQTS